jgi:hypothetical protein
MSEMRGKGAYWSFRKATNCSSLTASMARRGKTIRCRVNLNRLKASNGETTGVILIMEELNAPRGANATQ